ncbi:MAG: acetyl-CoA carboxylase, carboxyltransferase subunit beta [Candidatus Krumholzibacteria bacterium]|jgi:acetyl-CoA carboxylase carboxyl transferase subunit beta|nr:acetyl-CoA carboxylase, carboxyltransferase subunit beta [Candidatus Krumholzibacteria bacterium]
MSWLKRTRKGLKDSTRASRKEIPDGLWLKCSSCGEILFRQELEKSRWVCSNCKFHFRVDAYNYLNFLLDEGSFEETHRGLRSKDPLNFKAGKDRYTDKEKQARKKTGLDDAVVTGLGTVSGHPVSVSVMDFRFMGGSMGSVVGEKIARSIRDAIEKRRSLIIVSQSGGARMQESILSLMQMAKTSALLGELREAGLPYISILTHPTTGGVTASFAMLGDIILAEPKALIGFAGPRVIEQTIQTELPEGFQTSEFLQEHGMVDAVVDRANLGRFLGNSLRFFTGGRARAGEDSEGSESGIASSSRRSGGSAGDSPDLFRARAASAGGGLPLDPEA